jgi:hypothetical protein
MIIGPQFGRATRALPELRTDDHLGLPLTPAPVLSRVAALPG